MPSKKLPKTVEVQGRHVRVIWLVSKRGKVWGALPIYDDIT